ncbi:MAG: ADP-ribosylglycohydrolase family protein, partial [Ruminiclostridium sp.]|nr:ADP-ribosylglycohydrolase family protein [Ruminiclostridium sp.]
KDNGAVKRVAPVGLYFYNDTKKAFDMGCRAGAITHGSPVGYIAAGCYAAIIAEIVSGAEIEDAVRTVIELLGGVSDGEIMKKTLQYALELVNNESTEPLDAVKKMGYGFEAYEALAISVYCAVLHYESPRFAIQLAANHDGASDTCASMAAAMMGAYYGEQGFPKGWTDKLQYKNLISSLSEKLIKAVCAGDDYAVDDREED